MSRRLLLPLLLVLSTGFSAWAQNFQSSFTEPVFDTAKGPKSIFGGVKVDPATGRVTMDIPMGPGIGGRGAMYLPTLRLRESYIHTFKEVINNGYLAFPIATPWVITSEGIFNGCGASLNDSDGWVESHSGESTQSLLPGYFVMGLPHQGTSGNDLTSRFEAGDVNGALNHTSVVPAAVDPLAILQKFGYDSDVQLGNGPGYQFLGPGPWKQMASDRYLVMALSSKTASGPYEPYLFQEPYYTIHSTPTSIQTYMIPRAILVVDHDVAYEFTFAYTQTKWGATRVSDQSGNTMQPIIFNAHGIFRLSRILNAFGDQITFTYGTVPSNPAVQQILIQWLRNGQDTQVGLTLTLGSPISVVYNGLPQSQPISYSVGTGGTVWGSWIQHDPDYIGPWEGVTADLPDRPWAQIPLSFVVQDQTQERIDFQFVNGLPSVVYGTGDGSTPTRTVSLHWSGETQFLYCQKSATTPYPGKAWTIGVNQVDDTVSGPSGPVTRTTSYNRVIPVPNTWMTLQQQWAGGYGWVADPNGSVLANPIGWPSGSAYTCKVTQPDGRSVLYTYSSPVLGDSGLNYLLFVKNIPVEEDWYGTDGSLEKTITYSNFDLRSVGNPNGLATNPVPVATHWEIKDMLAGRWEIHDLSATGVTNVGWDSVNLGWAGEQVLVKDLNGNLWTDRTVGKALTSNLGVFLYAQPFVDTPVDPSVRPPVTRTYPTPPIVNLVMQEIHGAAGDLQVTLHNDWNTTTGLLDDAWVSDANVTTKAFGGKYGFDSNGFMNSIAPIDPAFAALKVSQASNGVGWPLSQTDPNGLIHQFAWDAAGRLQSSLLPNGELGHTYIYTPATLTVAMARGVQSETHIYNGFGGPIRVWRDNGDGTQGYRAFGYDSGGRLIWETTWGSSSGANADWTASVPPLPSTRYTYDPHNRVTQVVTPNNEVTQTVYTSAIAGYSKTVTLAPGTTAQQQRTDTYDPMGRLVTVRAQSETGALETAYTYDNADRLKSVIHWSGPVGTGPSQVRTWDYDHLGRLITLVQPESGTTSYSNFLPTGKPQTTTYGVTSSTPIMVSTSYDHVGRVTGVTSSDMPNSVSQSLIYGEQESGHGLALGKLVHATSNGVERMLDFNGLNGRLSNLTRKLDGQTFSLGIQYDPSYGLPVSRTYPDGMIQKLDYDWAKGIPKSSGFGVTPTASNLVSSLTPDPSSWSLLQIAWANGAASFFTYLPNQVGLLSMTHAIPGQPSKAWNYGYNEAGMLKSDGDDSYSYDKLGRLTGAFVQDIGGTQGLVQGFNYDAFGNRIGSSIATVTNWASVPAGTPVPPLPTTPVTIAQLRGGLDKLTVNMAFNANQAELLNNQIPAITNIGVPTGAAYDPFGNLIRIYGTPGNTATQLSLGYDALGRVTSLGDSANATMQTYFYDDEGLRIKTFDAATGKTTYHIYNEARQLIAVYELVLE